MPRLRSAGGPGDRDVKNLKTKYGGTVNDEMFDEAAQQPIIRKALKMLDSLAFVGDTDDSGTKFYDEKNSE
jgi:hypothetical protein